MPETKYAQSGDLSIAYQTVGEGPLDILFIPGFVSNVELLWDIPMWADMFTRFSKMGRFVFFDKRGTGCSDRSLGTGSAEDRMDDARAVADAAGIEQAVVIGLSEGGPLAILFATRVSRAGPVARAVGNVRPHLRRSGLPDRAATPSWSKGSSR